MPKIDCSSFSIDGPKGQNDDRLLLPITVADGWVSAVADGVGGNAGGGRAAEVALETIQKGFSAIADGSFKLLFDKACELMRAEASITPEFAKMATTLSVIAVSHRMARIGHVGDSRIYHIRDNGIVTRTRDQSEVAELVRQQVLTPAQAKRYPRRNVILSYLGPEAKFDLFEVQFEVRKNDIILLLTDGVYKEVRKSEILETLSNARDIGQFIEKIKEKLVSSEVRDDSTIVAIRV